MSDVRIDILFITVGIIAWVGIFAAAAQGVLHVSGRVSDGLLALLGIVIAYRLWRVYRRWSRHNA